MKTNHLFGLPLFFAAVCVTAGCNQNKSMTGKTATKQQAQYQTGVQTDESLQKSAQNGTASNNSNNTNYNSSNAVNNPTGAGSNANTPVTPVKPDNDRGSAGSANGAMNNAKSNAGTAAAIEKAPTNSKTPAVDAGSTNRTVNVGDFIASSPNYTTLQNALQATGLDETLKTGGPYTLFAPSNAAFKKVPTDLAGKLLAGDNRDALKQLLLYHVVEGTVNAGQLEEKIKASNGKAMLKTLAGGMLTATLSGGGITLTDEQGQTTRVTGSNAAQTNGIVHDVSSVLMAKNGASIFK